MTEIDPDEDPKKYHRKIAENFADALDKVNSQAAKQAAAEIVEAKLQAVEARTKEEREAARKETEHSRMLEWVGKQAAKSGLDMTDGSWDAKQFWRIFDHDLPGDLTVQDGVAQAAKMVKEEKELLIGKGVERVRETENKQSIQTPLQRSGADRPELKSGDYQRRNFDDLMDETTRGRKVRLRGG